MQKTINAKTKSKCYGRIAHRISEPANPLLQETAWTWVYFQLPVKYDYSFPDMNFNTPKKIAVLLSIGL